MFSVLEYAIQASLLRTYVNLDRRFPELLSLVKFWAKARGNYCNQIMMNGLLQFNESACFAAAPNHCCCPFVALET
jgi:hypothetical protein